MGLIEANDFLPPKRYRSGHYATFIPYLFGKKPKVNYERVRINTPDDDFLELDYIERGNNRLMVLCHGLEGSSKSGYVLNFAAYYAERSWDILAPIYRSCGSEMNRQFRSYNSGTTDDLHTALLHKAHQYDEVMLIGFSLGGNLVLKYLGEGVYDVPGNIRKAVAISTPLHLSDASKALLKKDNILYQLQFLRSLIYKMVQKKRRFPDRLDLGELRKVRNLYDFDHYFTAPMYGYDGAEDYYSHNQSIQWLDQIKIPTVILNAKNDPFLGPLCYPYEQISGLPKVHLCAPDFGGHVGFAYSRNDRSYMMNLVDEFIKSDIDVSINLSQKPA